MKHRRSCLPILLVFFILVGLILLAFLVAIPGLAWQTFGAPSASLNPWQRVTYAFELVWNAGNLTQAIDAAGGEQLFVIEPGESVLAISKRLEDAGLIRSASTFRSYLVWTGNDTHIQTGTYRLSPAHSGREIADMIISSSLTEVTFNILPGWRMEEVAASLPTSGLKISPDEFLSAAAYPIGASNLIPEGASAEGFLFPGKYTLPRTTSAEQLVFLIIQRSASELTPDLRGGFSAHSLTVYQAVTLASIIQREAVVENEMPMIASVFYNRLAINMPLQADPTVQYSLGYDAARASWWKTPLSMQDLQFSSPFNTYLHPGLPPGPISNPGLAALQAAASPASSNYLYFQARCDGSGLHNFAETLEQHHQNDCP